VPAITAPIGKGPATQSSLQRPRAHSGLGAGSDMYRVHHHPVRIVDDQVHPSGLAGPHEARRRLGVDRDADPTSKIITGTQWDEPHRALARLAPSPEVF